MIPRIIEGVLQREGEKFTNDPNDAGGPTKWGITQKALSAYLGRPASILEVQNLSHDDAYKILYANYVSGPKFDLVAEMSELIGEELVDSGVNCGVSTATLWLQKILNCLNRNQKDFTDIAEDGRLGLGSLQALRVFLSLRGRPSAQDPTHTEGELVLWRYLNALQGAYYISLGEKYKNDEEFIFGWGLARLGGRV